MIIHGRICELVYLALSISDACYKLEPGGTDFMWQSTGLQATTLVFGRDICRI
jgi:hypothetical protein